MDLFSIYWWLVIATKKLWWEEVKKWIVPLLLIFWGNIDEEELNVIPKRMTKWELLWNHKLFFDIFTGSLFIGIQGFLFLFA